MGLIKRLTNFFWKEEPTLLPPHPTGEANTSPWSPAWKPDHPSNWPVPKDRRNMVKLDKQNTIVLTEKKPMDLTIEQLRAVKIDEFRDEIKINAVKAKIYRHNTQKPQRTVRKRCRKFVDAANACFETKIVLLRNGKTKTVKTEKIKEGKAEEYQQHMADAKALAKTLRSRQTRPFNTTLHYQRTVILRKEQRSSHIAYGFIKQKPYNKIEDNPRWKNSERHPGGEKPDLVRIRKLIMQYSVLDTKSDFFQIEEALKRQLEVWKGN